MAQQRFFGYGWFIVAIAWICYGFGISPAYYTWGIFGKSVIGDLGYDRGQLGAIFGLFTLLYSCVGPLVGISQTRIGIRWTMVGGFVSTAVGLLITSRATTPLEFYLGFSILGGAGIGFATIVPCQTLGQNWFLRRRAMAIAIIFTSGGIVGKIVAAVNNTAVGIHAGEGADAAIVSFDWRTGWLIWAATSLTLAVIAALFIRDTPEAVGLLPDGKTPDDTPNSNGEKPAPVVSVKDTWTAIHAMGTSQFVVMVLCGCAYAVPWGVAVSQLPLHLQDIGFEAGVAGAFVGTMAVISIAGRLGGALGDWFSPQLVLCLSLAMEGLGMGLLLVARTDTLVYLCIACIALGFGTAYISVPVVFSSFFGRRAFGMTSGARIFVTGIYNGAGPWVAGTLFDMQGSYTAPFIAMMVLALAGSVGAALLRDPGEPAPLALSCVKCDVSNAAGVTHCTECSAPLRPRLVTSLITVGGIAAAGGLATSVWMLMSGVHGAYAVINLVTVVALVPALYHLRLGKFSSWIVVQSALAANVFFTMIAAVTIKSPSMPVFLIHSVCIFAVLLAAFRHSVQAYCGVGRA